MEEPKPKEPTPQEVIASLEEITPRYASGEPVAHVYEWYKCRALHCLKTSPEALLGLLVSRWNKPN